MTFLWSEINKQAKFLISKILHSMSQQSTLISSRVLSWEKFLIRYQFRWLRADNYFMHTSMRQSFAWWFFLTGLSKCVIWAQIFKEDLRLDLTRLAPRILFQSRILHAFSDLVFQWEIWAFAWAHSWEAYDSASSSFSWSSLLLHQSASKIKTLTSQLEVLKAHHLFLQRHFFSRNISFKYSL